MPKNIFLILLLFIWLPVSAQVLPKEGSALNYRIVGFSFPSLPAADKYIVEIATGAINSPDSFKKKLIKSVGSKTTSVIAELPFFNTMYTWRITYAGKKTTYSPLYHFSTATNVHIDTTKQRLRILQAASEQYKDYFVAVDCSGVLYDMSGNPVWYIPDTNGFGGNVGDLKFTPDGTVTFIYQEAYEITLNGDILWQTPKKPIVNEDTSARADFYQHEFTKLSNGHYMIMALYPLMVKTVKTKDSTYIVVSKDYNALPETGFRQGKFCGLIEFDEHGKALWVWRSSDYLFKSDFVYFNPADSNAKYDAHDNAFYFDEKNKVIYLGFRNLDRIIKIDYPSGKVIRSYGESFKPGDNGAGKGLFFHQHSIGKTSDGYLYVFNNNSTLPDATPSVVLLEEPVSAQGVLKKVWEYSSVAEGTFNKKFLQGGNVKEMADHSFFVNMGSKYSKLYIVSRNKEELWRGLPERYIETEQRWVPIYEYRANIISRKELEQLIWNAEEYRKRITK